MPSLLGLLQLAFYTTSLLSFADNGTPEKLTSDYAPLPEAGEQLKIVQRTLTAAAKAVICKVACVSLQECQEAMGGVGYMDEADEPEFNISRLYRDTAANMTWEGTTNVLGSEVVRHLLNGNNLHVFGAWLDGALANIGDYAQREALMTAWSILKARSLQSRNDDLAYALADARQTMFSLAWVVSGVLLAHDAQRDEHATAMDVARRWILDGEGGMGEYTFPDVVQAGRGSRTELSRGGKERVERDCRLVWGFVPPDAAVGYRRAKAKGETAGAPEQVVAKL